MTDQPRLRMVWVADAAHVDVQRWYKALEQAGVEIHLYSLRSGGTVLPQAHQIPITPALRRLKYIAAVPYVRQQIRRLQPDVLVAYYITGNGTLAALCGYRPLVLSSAGSDILVAPKNPVMRRLLQFNFSRTDLVTGLAPHMADVMRDLGVPEERIFVVPLGIPVESFAQTRCASPTPADTIHIVCTRALQPWYHIDHLIRALHILRGQGKEARLSIAGDGPERGSLTDLARALGVEQYVEFLGYVPNAQLGLVLARHNLYISVIQSDGVSSSLIEAMSVGLTPIVPDNSANRYWIEHRKTGLLLENIEPATIADAAIAAIENLTLRQSAWHDNLVTARQRGDLYHNTEIYVERLRQLVNGKRGKHASANL